MAVLSGPKRHSIRISVRALILTTALAVVATLTAGLSGAGARSRTEKVTVIGMDAVGRATGFEISEDQYRARLISGLSAVNTSIRPALKNSGSPSKGDVGAAAGTAWNLRAIGVGVGLRGELGLGPIVKVSFAPKLRLVFTNSLDPIYPN